MKALPEIHVKATVEVTYQGQTQTVTPQLRLERTGGVYSIPVPIPGPAGRQVMLKLDAPSKEDTEPMREVRLRTLNADDRAEAVQIDVSTKPGIGLVWLGSLLYTLGGLVAYRRRARELGITGLADVPETAKEIPGVPAARRTAKSKKR